MERFSTGNQYLDRRLNGGLPSGAITVLSSSPASQADPLFYSLMGQDEWLYLSTYRSRRAVEDELDGTVAGDVRVERVGTDDPVEGAREVLEELDRPRHVLVEPANPLEADEGDGYVELLNDMKEYLLETGRVGVLHCTEHGTDPPQRETTLTMADVVWDLSMRVNEMTVTARLFVPKYRSAGLVDEVINLDLGRTVGVDTSRNIS
jgi:hypothetical protein